MHKKNNHTFVSSLLISTLSLYSLFSSANEYCVDPDPSGIGNGSCTVVHSIADINAMDQITLPGGSTVRLKKGVVFRETLDVPTSGSNGSPITFTSYCANCNGNESPPKLSSDLNIMNKYDKGFENGAGSLTQAVGNNTAPNVVIADANNTYGDYALRLERDVNGSGLPYVRINIGNIKKNTSYYLGLSSKLDTDSEDGLRVRLYDKFTNKDLQINGSWAATSTYHKVISHDKNTWVHKGLGFKTDANTDDTFVIRLDIVAKEFDTQVLVDNLYLIEVPDDVYATSSFNGDFEDFTGTIDDTSNDDFSSWYEANVVSGNQVLAVDVDGSTAIKMHLANGAPTLYLRRGIQNIKINTEYNLAVLTKINTNSPGSIDVVIKDEHNNKYLNSDGTWGSIEYLDFLSTAEDGTWENKSFNFQTLPTHPSNSSTTRVRFDFVVRESGATVFLDNVKLHEARQVNADKSGNSQGHAIVIDNKDYIVIDGIDVSGTLENDAFDDYGLASEKLINVANGSSNITIKNTDLSLSSGVGIWSDHDTTDITFDAITAYDNANTAIYMNSDGGEVINSLVYNNGKNYRSLDRGGIGIQGADITISNNEVYNNGPDAGHGDFEISVAGASGKVDISYNYVHDCIQGCIQVANDENSSSGFNHLIAYNIISGFATTQLDHLDTVNNQETKKASMGSYVGIRVGGVGAPVVNGCNTQSYVTNVEVYNNVITGGKTPTGDTGLYDHMQGAGIYISRFDTSGLKIRNNIILDNEQQAIYSNHTALQTPAGCASFGSNHTGYDFSHNLFEHNATFAWKGDDDLTLSEWQDITTDSVVNLDRGSAELDSTSDITDVFVDPNAVVITDEMRYELISNSPGIDTGDNLAAGVLTTDYSGNSIDANRDKGAFEDQ